VQDKKVPRPWHAPTGLSRLPTSKLQAEVLCGDSGEPTEALHHRSGESVAFTDGRQFHEVRRDASSTPKIDEARAELLDTNGVLRIPVASSADNELSQSRHLGEGVGHVLRGVCGRDANPGRWDNDSARPQYPELEHWRWKLQSGPPEHGPILFRCARKVVEWLLVVTESDRNVADDDLL